MSAKQSFRALVAPGPKGGVVIPLPFSPHALWGKKPRHLIGGSIAGKRFRGEVEFVDGQPALVPKPAWLRDNLAEPGMEVDVEIAPKARSAAPWTRTSPRPWPPSPTPPRSGMASRSSTARRT